LLDPKILPDYPYRDDGLLMHTAIENHVRRIVEKNYFNDVIYLTEDFEMQAWANDLVETDPLLGCNIKGIPGEGKFESFDELVKTLTSIIFMCTAGHAAVNLPQYDEYGYSPNYPTLLVGEPPCDTRWRDKHDVLRHLPTKDLCLQSVIYAKLMTDRKTNGLADFNSKFQYDPIALKSGELFLKDLKDAAITVIHRNLLRKYPYDYLNPCSSKN
ncbi:arachidonate 5-lipoxygenase-like, partial [Paramuricea clavata]